MHAAIRADSKGSLEQTAGAYYRTASWIEQGHSLLASLYLTLTTTNYTAHLTSLSLLYSETLRVVVVHSDQSPCVLKSRATPPHYLEAPVLGQCGPTAHLSTL